jgi:hypothetical protein
MDLHGKDIRSIASNASLSGLTALTGIGLEVASHNPITIAGAGFVAYVCWKYNVGEKLLDLRQKYVEAQKPDGEKAIERIDRRIARQTLEKTGDISLEEEFNRLYDEMDMHPFAKEGDQDVYEDEEDDLRAPVASGPFTFSQVLREFTPSRQKIYLGKLMDGTPIYSTIKELCHIALAGATGNGKTSLIRLIAAQLCKVDARVLMLNPHYTHYDLSSGEDWTPFEPYFVYDPMECRRYEIIEYYLKQVAKEIMPKRLDKFAHSQPVGNPYFIILDELPSIVRNVPDAPAYLEAILQEGRKVGIYLITAAQDFLVKTIAPQGGGAMRECYRTALYVGGDATTAKILLDIPAREVPENDLGKGTIMIRNVNVKKAQMAQVPYVDNQALYTLLGPSTYKPSATPVQEVELVNPLTHSPETPKIGSVLSSNRMADLPTRESVRMPVERRENRENGREYSPYSESAGESQEPGFAPEDVAAIMNAYARMNKEKLNVSRQSLLDWMHENVSVSWNNKKWSLFKAICDAYGILPKEK